MASTADWQGRVGREWADKADALDRLLGPVGEAGIAALGEVNGRSILDLGCGSGATALALAERGAKVTGVDISADLLARARQRDKGGAVDFVQADATTYTPETPLDVLHSRCGAMFFDDQIAAWSHLRTQLRPGAPIALTVWRAASENEWAFLPLRLAAPVLGEEATRIHPPEGPGPFAWSDPAHFAPILERSGWTGIAWEPVTRDAVMETGDATDPAERGADFAMRIGPLASRLRGIDEVTRARIRAELVAGFEPLVRDGRLSVSTSAWVIRATG